MEVLVVAMAPAWREPTGVADMADLLVLRHPDLAILEQLGRDLSVGTAISASLTEELSPDAGEAVRGMLGIDRTHLETTRALLDRGWLVTGEDERRTMLSPPRGMPARAVGQEEFAELIEAPVPVSTRVIPDEVSLADERLFGVFASTRRGGSSALLALSGARPGPEPISLRNPAALALDRVDASPWSPFGANVTCAATGLSPGGGADLAVPEGAAQLWEARDREHEDYWLLVELAAGDVDPPVWLPAGQIFEQSSLNGRQTLATTAGSGTLVEPGRRSTLLLPAYCLDRHLDSPAGDRMRMTPLRARLPLGSTQQRVWNQRVATSGATQ